MESIQSKLESELLKMKNENVLIVGKKVIPDIAKRLASLFVVLDSITQPTIELKGGLEQGPILTTNDNRYMFLNVLSKIKEQFGSIPAWRIPEDEFMAIVEECRKGQ